MSTRTRFVRLRALAGSLAGLGAALAISTDALAQSATPPAVGYFQTQNMRWGISPKPVIRPDGGQAMHFSPWSNSTDNPGASTSFFPQIDLKIAELYELGFKMYIPAGSICEGGGSPRMVVQLDDGAGNTPTYNIYMETAAQAACASGTWSTLDFMGASAVWRGPGLGGGSKADAHGVAQAAHPNYRIRVIRINFGGGAHAWFDDERVNGLVFTERAQDASANALLPDDATVSTQQTPAVGYYQTRNIRWGLSPRQLSRPKEKEAMHFSAYSHSPTEPFMSTSFFPQTTLQIRDLYQMGFDFYLPPGSTCGGGSPSMVVQVQNAPGTITKNLYAYSADTGNCATDQWRTLDFLNGPGVRLDASALGGSANSTKTGAHVAAVNQLGGSYSVKVIRIGHYGGPEAWFDNEVINGAALKERVQDFSDNALAPDLAATGVRVPAIGYYQTRNIRWGLSPKQLARPKEKEAMHFSAYSHTPAEPFMSTSFFPQAALQLRDLYTMGFDFYLPPGSTCGGGSPRMVVQVQDAAGTVTRDVIAYSSATANCVADVWTTIEFIGAPGSRLDATQLGGSATAGTDSADAAAVSLLGANYKVRVIRINFDAGGPEASIDNENINGATLRERAQDFSLNALLPDSALVPAGILPSP